MLQKRKLRADGIGSGEHEARLAFEARKRAFRSVRVKRAAFERGPHRFVGFEPVEQRIHTKFELFVTYLRGVKDRRQLLAARGPVRRGKHRGREYDRGEQYRRRFFRDIK